MRSIFIPSYHIFFSFSSTYVHIFSSLLSDSPSLTFSKSMLWASVLASVGMVGWSGGQQVEDKHTCLPHPLCLSSWGCQAEGPINGPSEPCNQHCQAQVPVEHTGLTLQTVCGETGQTGQPAGCCCCAGGKHGACQTTASLSWGSAWLDGPDVPRHWGEELIHSQVMRGHHTSMIAREKHSSLHLGPLNCDSDILNMSDFLLLVLYFLSFHFVLLVSKGFFASQGWKFNKYAWE